MECEMCGKQVGTRRYSVDGTAMQLGPCCSRHGTPLDAPPQAPGPQGLERRAKRMQTRNVYTEETMDLVEGYGQRVRQARQRKGWTEAQLGDKVSARVPELKQIESGRLRPSDKLTKALEKTLGITLMEKVESGSQVSGVKKPTGQGVTIGDILKDAMDK